MIDSKKNIFAFSSSIEEYEKAVKYHEELKIGNNKTE